MASQQSSEVPKPQSSADNEAEPPKAADYSISPKPENSTVVALLNRAFGLLESKQGTVECQAQAYIQKAIDLLTDGLDKPEENEVSFVEEKL